MNKATPTPAEWDIDPTFTYRTASAQKLERRGYRIDTVSADWLFKQLPADGSCMIIWKGFGHDRAGREMFGTSRMRRAQDGQSIECLTGEGRCVSAYPLGQGRTLRTPTVALESREAVR